MHKSSSENLYEMLITVTYESWTIIFKTFILLGRQELASIFVHFQGLPEVF